MRRDAAFLGLVACERAIIKRDSATLFFNVNGLILKSVRRKIGRRDAGSGQSAPHDAIMHCFTDSWLGAAYAGEKMPGRENEPKRRRGERKSEGEREKERNGKGRECGEA